MMRTVIEEGSMAAELCTYAPGALAQIASRSFQAMVIDFDLEDAAAVLQQARKKFGSNRFVALAMTSTDTKSAMTAGATLVVHKPISMERARSALRLVRNLVVRKDKPQLHRPDIRDEENTGSGKLRSLLGNLKLSS